MKKIILIILCVMLSLSLPALAAPEQTAELSTQPNSVEQVTQRVSDISTDLKLQQQKLEFFKERLAVQDKRIDDLSDSLGTSVDLFGYLITLVVVILTLSSTVIAVLKAKTEARKEIGSWLDKEGKQELIKKVEDTLHPEIAKAVDKIDTAASDVINKLDEERLKASRNNEEHKNKINELDEIKEILGSLVDKEKPLSMEQMQEVEEAEKELKFRPPNEYSFEDWIMLGKRAFESKKYEVALDHFIQAENVSSEPIEQANALLNKGSTLGQMGRRQEAIAIYEEVARRFGEATETPLREQVANALVNKGFTLGQMGKKAEAIAICDEVVRRFGEATETPLREQVANALVNKGFTLGEMGKRAEAIAIFEEVVRRFDEAAGAPLRKPVARALQLKGFNLRHIGKYQEAIAIFDEVVRRFGEATETPLRVQVAGALLIKALTFDQIGKYQEAIAIYDEVVRRFGEATETPLRELVEGALRNKSFTFERMSRTKNKE